MSHNVTYTGFFSPSTFPLPPPPALSNLHNVTFSSISCFLLLPPLTSLSNAVISESNLYMMPSGYFSLLPSITHLLLSPLPFSLPISQPSPGLSSISPVFINLCMSIWRLFNRKYPLSLLSFLLFWRDCADNHRDDIPALMSSSDLAAGSVRVHLQYKYIHKGLGASALSDPAVALCHWNHW